MLKGKKKPSEAEVQRSAHGLEFLFKSQIHLDEKLRKNLQDEFEKGIELFDQFNTCRLELAFKSFDESMKIALYEILYLLHVNEPFLEEIKFETKEVVDFKETTINHNFNLYVKDAPCGVAGIENLPELYKSQLEQHVLKLFNQNSIPSANESPISGIFSIGSIGTIGHKHLSSDLDLEVLYRLEPQLIDTSAWSDKVFIDALHNEIRLFISRIQKQQGIASDKRLNSNLKLKLKNIALEQVSKKYPYLYSHLITKKTNYLKKIEADSTTPVKRRLIDEIIKLMDHKQSVSSEKLIMKDTLLREKISKIQDYIETRYPEAEIYLFPLSEQDMKRGYFGSTLDSKESSGSAYEKIMSFDTLMPGVFYTQTIPAHFVFPKSVNQEKQYKRILDYIRHSLLDDIYSAVKFNLMDQGPTGNLEIEYVGNHLGAVYWEAFKASSGNLPKALLNLFRYEMLFEKKINKTVIQIVKDPIVLNEFALEEPTQKDPPENQQFLPFWAICEIEKNFPKLLFDPWWLRYKALKIGFGEKNDISEVNKDEQARISSALDLAFAVHIRLSDVFTKAGSLRKFELHREKVLLEYLKYAFPPNTKKRHQIEQIFIGEVSAVNEFEAEMRKLFKRSIKRVRKKVAKLGIEDALHKKKEYQIWFHYYEKNFETPANEIHRSILNHLKVPRGRVQIGYKIDQGWFFRSLQMESSIGKRFDMFSIIDQLPPKVGLIDDVPFLFGLAYCIFNGYYGILNRGTLKEKQTSLEFDGKHMNLGSNIDNSFAYVHPGQVDAIMNKIIEFFPYKKVDHRDCLKEGTKITELLVFLNLIKFGRLSFLFRNNLGSIYSFDHDHPQLHTQAEKLNKNYEVTIHSKPINVTLKKNSR